MAEPPSRERSGGASPDQLMPQVYDELRRLAANYLRHERPGQTLQATALVHEAYLRLGKEKNQPWKNRTHFLAIAALSMRQILVQRARARHAEKRGGPNADRITLEAFQHHLLRELRDTAYEPAFALMELDERPLVASINFASPEEEIDRLAVALTDRCFGAAYFRTRDLA